MVKRTMSPNNYSLTETTTNTEQQDACELNQSGGILVNRKNKNILNSLTTTTDVNGNLIEAEPETEIEADSHEYKIEPAWFNIFGFMYLHYVTFVVAGDIVDWNKTLAFAIIIGLATGFGITGGAHRLWAHGSYKANKKLKVLLVIFQTTAFQNSVIEWVRDHRVHHKFTDTNADPHNASRGFFFSHMGWLMCKKHPDVKKFGAKVNMSDLESDPILAFQHKYFFYLMPILCFGIPTFIPWYFWGETLYNAYVIAAISRWVVCLHLTWMINSAAHMWGNKPYDRFIKPVDTYIVSCLAFGEGFHNYHHVFPWDYKTSELGFYWCNLSTALLDFLAWLGWATDLKTVSPELIQKRVLRTGDGSHTSAIELLDAQIMDSKVIERDLDHFWGWNDELLTEEDKRDITIINKTDE